MAFLNHPNHQLPSESSSDQATRRVRIIKNHISGTPTDSPLPICRSPCLQYSPPEASNTFDFIPRDLRKIFDGHNLMERDWVFGLMTQCELFNPRKLGGRVFVSPDFNLSMEQQRELTMRRIDYLRDRGVFKGFLTGRGVEAEMLKLSLFDVFAIYDHSLAVKIGVHFFLWGGAIQFFGTKRHHDKWLKDTEDYVISGSFAMSELGHGSNVRGIETLTTYDSNTEEFVINTPTESAQKYWIGGAAEHATHTIVLSQLYVEGKNQGVHAFIAQIRDRDGKTCPNTRIADCGHKIGLNGVDNGRIWFDNLRIPRENLLNSVADVSPDGRYLSAINDPDQRFAAFLAPLTSGRVNIASGSLYSAKVGLATAIRYSLTRRAFSVAPNEPEVLLLDYPSHQRRLLPLLAKTCAMSFGANYLKSIYVSRTPESNKTIHILSSAFKATFTWHNMRTLQECREACGGQGIKTENRIGQLTSEFDVQSTFEGDNNVLMQQVSKALFAEYTTAQKRNKPVKGLGLEYMNKPLPVLPSHLTSSTLRCTQFQTNILCVREQNLLIRFAAQVSEHQAQGQSKESAFILSYQLAEDLGRAFSERAIMQTFIEAEATVSDASLQKVLSLLRCMYAMICIEEDAAFLQYGLLTTENAARVRNEVSRLCNDLRPHALAVVDSFGIPEAFLGPIAFDWIKANSWSSTHS